MKRKIRITKDFLIRLVTCSQTVMITQQSHERYLPVEDGRGYTETHGRAEAGKVSTMNREIKDSGD